MPIQISDIEAARARMRDKVQITPMDLSRSLSRRLGCQAYLKLENQQATGSFKIRGSLNKIMSLSKAELAKGIVAASAGNHAQGVAYAATTVGAKSRVVMPETTPLVKVMATQNYGAEVILRGTFYDEAYAHAQELEKEHGLTFIHPYNDPLIMAGQGTLGLEIFDQVNDLDSIIVPIGGGGLISGVAVALKTLHPKIKIFGAVSTTAPGVAEWFHGQELSAPSSVRTIADGISVKKPNREIFDNYISKYVDDVVAVDDEAIAGAIVFFLERAKTLVEGSAAVTLAAAEKAGWNLGAKTCLLLSGGNIDLNLVSKVIERGMSEGGRLARISVCVSDRPGTLMKLTDLIAQAGGNVLDVRHDRTRPGIRLSETIIEFLIETRSHDQVEELRNEFAQLGEVLS